jgi:amidophosphoribosyltransferase
VNELNEKCGIFGVYGQGLEASRLTYYGLWALQHRGQESSGITSSNGHRLFTHKDTGLVAHVYSEENIQSLKGHIAIGHNRYSTSGGATPQHNQPVTANNASLSLAHNGNLPTTTSLRQFLKSRRIRTYGLNDSEMIYQAIKWHLRRGSSIEDAIKETSHLFTGSYALLIMTRDKLVALRDKFGIRPLSIGKLNGGWVFSSETCALTTTNAGYLRDVRPGEMVVVDDGGLSSYQLEPGEEKLDIFEFVYFARPDSILLGKSVYEVRKNLGRILATQHPIAADIIIPVPDSSIPAALGYSEVSKIPIDDSLVKNRYIHRTFIQPAQQLRELGVDIKINPIVSSIKGKRVALIDDSIVRGTTSKMLVQKIRAAGASTINLLISSPPFRFPDFYGIDTPDQSELIAANKSVEEIRKYTTADSLHYLSYEGLVKATGLDESNFCTSCFTGTYPIDIGEEAREISYLPIRVA